VDKIFSCFSIQIKFFQKLFCFLFLICFLFSLVPAPALATDDSDSEVLISDRYIILRDGDIEKLEQGYEIELKGYKADAVSLEFYNNYRDGVFIGSVIVKEGETVSCYRKFGNEEVLLLRMTLDKLYMNNSQAVAGFSHVTQFKDRNTLYSEDTLWKLESAVLDDSTNPGPSDPGKNNGIGISPDLIKNPIHIIFLIGFIAVAMVFIHFLFKKRITP